MAIRSSVDGVHYNMTWNKASNINVHIYIEIVSWESCPSTLERWQVFCRLNRIWFGSSLHNTNISGELLSKRRDLDLTRPFSAIWILNAAHPRAAVPGWFAVCSVRACTHTGRDGVWHCLGFHNKRKANYRPPNPYQPVVTYIWSGVSRCLFLILRD